MTPVFPQRTWAAAEAPAMCVKGIHYVHCESTHESWAESTTHDFFGRDSFFGSEGPSRHLRSDSSESRKGRLRRLERGVEDNLMTSMALPPKQR